MFIELQQAWCHDKTYDKVQKEGPGNDHILQEH